MPDEIDTEQVYEMKERQVMDCAIRIACYTGGSPGQRGSDHPQNHIRTTETLTRRRFSVRHTAPFLGHWY